MQGHDYGASAELDEARTTTDAMLGVDLLELVDESIFLRDLSGRIRYWNKASEELYGWSSAEALGQPAHELLRCQHTEALTCLNQKVLDDGRWSGELSRRSADGRELLIETRWSLRRDASGAPQAIVESGRDITARKATDLVLAESEYRYRNLFQAMAASFWELDFTAVGAMVRSLFKSGITDLRTHFRQHPELVREMMRATRVLDVNEQTVHLFGRGTKAELLTTVEPFWPQASSTVFAESIIAAVTKAPSYVKETRLRTIDGKEFDVLFTASFPPENMQKGILMVGVIDLSARNQAYAALEQSESRYRNLFEVMAVSFWQLDSSGTNRLFAELREQGVSDLPAYIDQHPEFVRRAMDATLAIDVNQRTLELYGARERGEMLGSVSRFWIPGHDEAFRHSLEAAWRREPGYLAETKTRTLDGRELDVLFFVTAPPEMRERGMVLVGNIDISELVASRNALQRMQSDLTHAARISMLGELTASIAHEVNQPLAAIATYGEAGLRWLGRPQPDLDEVRDLTQRMVGDARRAAEIIARIRGMARQQSPEPQMLSLNALAKEAAAFLRHELQSQGVTLRLDLETGLPRLRGDRTLLQQVLVNLLVNALQAMAQAECALRSIVLSTRRLDEQLQLRVEDSGPGIAAEHVERLFDSFFTTKRNGMGMGLPICRSIVENCGGSIEAEPRPAGQGACFVIRLPLPST
jgi:PAS domain S-box-containing protein